MCVSEAGEGDRDREVLVVTDSMKVLSALTDQIQVYTALSKFLRNKNYFESKFLS